MGQEHQNNQGRTEAADKDSSRKEAEEERPGRLGDHGLRQQETGKEEEIGSTGSLLQRIEIVINRGKEFFYIFFDL